MGNRSIINKSFFYFIFSLLILWIILFEFILPGNNILPKPSTVLISIPDLFKDYNFLYHFLTTITAVYLPGILAYLFIFSMREYILNETGIIKYSLNFISGLNLLVPSLMLIFILIYWFPHSFYVEYVFSFLLTVLWLLVQFHSNEIKKNENYLLAFKSMGGNSAFINKNLLWNELKPGIFKRLYPFHIYLWTLILIFEFIHDGYGIGTIFKKALYYIDFSVLILMIILVPVIIYCGFICLKLIEDKFVFWEPEWAILQQYWKYQV